MINNNYYIWAVVVAPLVEWSLLTIEKEGDFSWNNCLVLIVEDISLISTERLPTV